MNATQSNVRVQVKSRGKDLDMRPESFGLLNESHSRHENRDDLLAALAQYGYLFLRDMFDVGRVDSVRGEICDAMSRAGLLNDSHPKLECVPSRQVSGNDKSKGSSTFDGIPAQCPSMTELLYGEGTRSFFEKLLGGSVRHYDLTWFRGVAPGLGTVPHCDVVYMGRGTHKLYTMWVPYGQISLEMGGLMVLEGSHHENVQEKIRKYTARDVDEYCENRPIPEHVDLTSDSDNKVWNGWLAHNPVTLRNNLGGRW